MRISRSKQAKSRTVQGLVFAAGVAAIAWRMQALSRSGAAAATLVGAAVYSGMGMRGSMTLAAYFVSSSALGRLPGLKHPVQQRGNRRDAVQVLANGGPAALFSLLHAWSPATPNDFAETAFYGSLASAAADTWATEIGTRWGGQPRSIVSGRVTPVGESGGVTAGGLSASVLASAMVAVAAQLGKEARPGQAIASVSGGIVGSLADSFLGSLVQEQRWCETCGVPSELRVHICGQPTIHLSGVPAVTNDVVNLMSVIAGGVTASTVSSLIPKLTRGNGSRVEFFETPTNSGRPTRIGAP